MSHFYKVSKSGDVRLLKSVTTPTQARKSNALASVTTMLGCLPNDFLSGWMRRQIWDMAQCGISWEECERRRYGMRQDVDGREVTSSEFGTSVHKALECHLDRMAEGDLSPNNGPYATYVNPFAKWFRDTGHELVAAESICYCLRRKTAGTIDVLAKDSAGQYVLMDFKTRSVTVGKPEAKAYIKDCAQLAVEADIIREREGLDYMPNIMSIVIAVEDGRTGIRRWTRDQQEHALDVFDACCNLYLIVNKLR